MIEQNFSFNGQLPILHKQDDQSQENYSTSTPPASTNVTSPYNGSTPQTGQSTPSIAANYAMAQQLGQSNYGSEYGSMYHRSSYIHSHAKPPYSYISLIAMSIQVNSNFFQLYFQKVQNSKTIFRQTRVECAP